MPEQPHSAPSSDPLTEVGGPEPHPAAPDGALRGRDLLSIADLSHAEVELLLARAAGLKAGLAAERAAGAAVPSPASRLPLARRSVALLFEHPSLRTRVSFEAGMTQLGGHAIDLSGDRVGLGRRESVADVAHNLERFVDAIVVRTASHPVVEALAAAASIPVVNALTDLEHPCQALADLLTIRETFGRLDGLVLAFVGDGNNVFHSLALAGMLTGMEIRLAHPDGHGPSEAVVEAARRLAGGDRSRLVLTADPDAAVRGADVVYTDAWTSMGQEAAADARRSAFEPYRVDDRLVARAAPGAVVMHCLPAHRGEEITSEVLDGPRSIVFAQAENRLHTQKALLLELLAGGAA